MAKSVKAIVKAELLVWARESAHLRLEEAARKAQVKEEQLVAWEKGERQPSIPQLRKLGRVYEIRRAWARREIALDLYRELVGEPEAFPWTASLDESPEDVATRLREGLGVTRTEPASWRNAYDALNRWRGALEEAAVLVFQAEDVEVSEMRGFSLSERLFPAVVVNIKDAVVGRVFTMLHEATHLMLREGGLCDLLEESTLMPRAWMLEEEVVHRHRGAQWADEETRSLSQSYRVSREAVLRRLLILGKTTEDFYRKKRRELQAEFEAKREETEERKALGLEAGGFAPPDRMAVSTAGPFFVRLVLESYHQEKITPNELSSFLGVRLKHVSEIEQAVLTRAAASGARA
jgi:Zn-dependent peptidase ImmA (M78 family)/DNA-binding XRE family transcriptional regulator